MDGPHKKQPYGWRLNFMLFKHKLRYSTLEIVTGTRQLTGFIFIYFLAFRTLFFKKKYVIIIKADSWHFKSVNHSFAL